MGIKVWKERLEKLLSFLRFEVWFIPTKGIPFWKRVGMEVYKIIAVTVKKSKKDGVLERSSALSYYSMLAVVPILAMVFGFAGGFGFDKALQGFLTSESIVESPFWGSIIDFAHNMLRKTNSGLIGGVGVIFLFWIIINVITRIEYALNKVWEIRKARTWLRKATDYITLIVLSPLLLFAGISAGSYLSVHLTEMVNVNFFQSFARTILSLIPLVSGVTLICLIYIILPNRKMPLLPVIVSGIITGLAFLIVQSLYVKLQVYMSSYNIIYGSFAALPLFLIWLRVSWVILLMGAELGVSIHRREHYIFETDYKHLSEFRRKIYALQMVSLIVKNFEDKKGGMSVQMLAAQMGSPQPYLFEVARELTETGILTSIFVNDYKYTYEAQYQPAFDTHQMKVYDVLHALDIFDYKEEYCPHKSDAYCYFENYMRHFDSLIDSSSENVLIRDFKF